MSVDFVASQLFFKTVDSVLPKYRYLKLSLNNQSSSAITWQVSSSQQLQWKIPACTVFNPARSFLTHQYTIPASAGNYGWYHQNAFDYRNISFQSQSGLPIVSIENVDMHVRVLRPYRTQLSKFLTMDALGQLAPSNMPASSNILPFSRDGLLYNAGTGAGVEVASTRNYQEQQYMVIANASNTALNVNRYVPLSAIVDTFLSQDLDVVFGQDMILNALTSYLSRMVGYTNTPNNPNANLTAITSNIAFSNVYLHLACEDNIAIKNSLLNSLSNGKISLPCPYTYLTRFSQSGSTTSFNQSLTITKGYGRFLKRVCWTPVNSNEYDARFAYDFCNLNGSKVTQYLTYYNSKPSSDFPISCYNPNSNLLTYLGTAPSDIALDWRENSKYLEGSAIGSYAEYQTNWSHIDTFGMKLGESRWHSPKDSNINDGWDLHSHGELIWMVSAQTPGANINTTNIYTNGMIHYVNQLFQRQLEISPSGFNFDW